MTPGEYTNRQQRRAQLLHFAGPDVQDIFLTLPNTGTVRDYDAAVTALNAYFVPKVNPAYARHTFRQMTQRPGETVRQFVTRLWTAANNCDYGADTENQIRDEVLCKCNSDYLRRKLLEVGPDLTLTRALELAGQCEELDTQMSMLSLDRNNTVEAVSQVDDRTAIGGRKTRRRRLPADRKPRQNDNMNNQCYRCGKTGHWGRYQCCPARGKTCNLCNGKDHFSVVCQTKKQTKGRVHQVHCPDFDSDYAFRITSGLLSPNSNTVNVCVGGVCLDVMIDSGCSHNIVDEHTWAELKKSAIKCTSSVNPTGKQLYTYASEEPLTIKGTFGCNVRAGNKTTQAEFVVIKGTGIPLICKETAKTLGMLKIGINVAATADSEPSQVLKQHIDPNVMPVAQPLRRTPFNLREEKVESKIESPGTQNIADPLSQLLEELEEPYRAKWKQLGQEAECCRTQYNQLKYEYTFLKAEFEHERAEHQGVVDEMKMLHEKETTNLRRERDILINKNQAGGSTEAQGKRTLACDTAQLKGLLSELDEVRAQNEHQGSQSDHVTRLQVKQLAETTTSLKASETERESLKLHVDSLQRELSSSTDEQSRVTTRVHELEKDAVQLKRRADEVTHRSKVEVATLKMDLMKERGELERERDRQCNQIEELTCQVETLKLTCDNYTQRLDEKEREMGESLQATRAEEWQKQHNSCQTLSSVEEDTRNDADDGDYVNPETTATVEPAGIDAPVATVPSSPPNEPRATRPLRETRMQNKFDDFVT